MLKNVPNHKMFFAVSKLCGFVLSRRAKTIKKKIAKIKFETGPAAETNASSFNGSFKFLLLTGTGFAQPINANPEANAMIGIRTLPTKSKCFIGFNVSLPKSFAVESPFLFATKA